MGHALHHMLSNIEQPLVSGINGVAWDTVEFPSQFLEYFSYEKEVLEIFAKHYETKEVLGNSAIDKLINSRNFQSALTTIRQVEFALFDFKLYQSLVDEKGVQDLLDEIRDEISVIFHLLITNFKMDLLIFFQVDIVQDIILINGLKY